MERFLYRPATRMSVISESFRRNLNRKGVPPEKITLIPVWADPDIVRPLPKENGFRERLGLSGELVVMYAGNLGLTSCLEDVLGAAKLLKGQADIRFVVIGEGVKKTVLRPWRKIGLTNVMFLPYQPREIFPEMLAAADLGLVTLNHSSASFSLPSKTFNVMASARPILAVAPSDSELAHLVEDARCGMVVPPEHPACLAEILLVARASCSVGRNGPKWTLSTRKTIFPRPLRRCI